MLVYSWRIFAKIIFPLLIGILIYLFSRDISVLEIGKYLPKFFISNLRLPEWIKYNLLDGLWLYSSLQMMLLVWKKSLEKVALYWYSLLILLAFGSEIIQYYHPEFGTFDFYDIIFYIIPTLICFTFLINKDE